MFWCLTVSLSLSHWYPGSGVVLVVSIPDLCILTYYGYEINFKANIQTNSFSFTDLAVFSF